MDELLQHCVRELAFEGVLGCNVIKLQGFVNDFYTSHVSIHQTLDASYYAFVWSLLVQQPSVRVGIVPEGQVSEIYVPPQPRVGKKEKSEDILQESLTAVRLELIADAHLLTLEELVEKYGARLRMSVDPEMCFVALTGSHAKPAKLTPIVYATLQLIARSRERGISVLDIGKATGYDQKTCFYLVKQLVDLDLVVKLRRGGTSQNFCVHKYFFDFSLTWTRIREEEHRAQQDLLGSEQPSAGAESPKLRTLDTLHFDPIDERHLASLSILRQRLAKLLKLSPGCMQPYVNIAVRVGFQPRSRTERRFFLSRLKELVYEGTVEKVLVKNPKPGAARNKLLYLRLCSSNEGGTADDIDVVTSTTLEEPDEEDIIAEDGFAPGVKSTLTLHKQIIDLIENSSTAGITLSELSDRLGSFDKRTLDLLISRMERQGHPNHLADLSIVQVLEFHGRERRYRFFTLANYDRLVEIEGLQESSRRCTAKDVELAGNFMEIRGGDFYETHGQLLQYLDKWAGKTLGRPLKRKVEDLDEVALPISKRKTKEKSNPILLDGTRKRGRPPKTSKAVAKTERKRKKESGDENQDVDHRPTTVGLYSASRESEHGEVGRNLPVEDSREGKEDIVAIIQPFQQIGAGTAQALESPAPSKRKRGRPPKSKSSGFSKSEASQEQSVDSGKEGATQQPITRDPREEQEDDVCTNALGVSSAVYDLTCGISSREQTPGTTEDPRDILKNVPSSRFSRKMNISALRRENEIVRMIERAGGIVNTSANDFIRMFMDFVQALVKAGEVTSAPIGSKADRRTLSYSLDKLEMAGRIKTMSSMTGMNRIMRIAYLPDMEEEKLREFIHRQGSISTSPSQRSKRTRRTVDRSASVDSLALEDTLSLDQVEDRADETQLVPDESHESQRRRRKSRTEELKQEQIEELRALSAGKSEESIRLRTQQWDAMVDKVHPGLLKGVAAARLRKLRQSFIRGNIVQSDQLWEMEIGEAIKAAERFRSARKLFSPRPTSGVRLAINPQMSFRAQPQITEADRVMPTSTEMRIDLDAPIREKGKDAYISDTVSEVESPVKQKGRARRHRFQWTSEHDDTLCDASVIIRSRCRTHRRLEWTALDRVFPHIPRSTVKMRLSILKAQPGAEAYLRRLENTWHEIWIRDRDTPSLPDDNPLNPLEFDIKRHIEYLRKSIDKNAIRVGITKKDEIAFALPLNPLSVFESWDLVERRPSHSVLDSLFNSAIAEDAREKLFRETSLTLESDCNVRHDEIPDTIAFAESALKMIVGTPNEVYDADDAAGLLRGIDEDIVTSALDDLLSSNVMSKLVRDPNRLVPGRTVKISEVNMNALNGSFSQEFFWDASQLEESYNLDQPEWHEWPFTATEGDTAAILQQISDHNVCFDVDTSHARTARAIVEGNSRRADDDDIELDLRVRFIATPARLETIKASTVHNEHMSIYEDTDRDFASHGEAGGKSCRLSSGGIVDCPQCLDLSKSQLDQWEEPLNTVATTLLDILENQGASGIKIEELMEKAQGTSTKDQCRATINCLSRLNVPLVYFIGYKSSKVISAKYLGSWAVTISRGSDEAVEKIFPRRWLDVRGNLISEVWICALRAVLGLVHMRPGLTLAELRWRLRAVYDRQEIIDILNYLLSKNMLYHTAESDCQLEDVVLAAISMQEENAIHWFIRDDTHWYRV